MSHQKAKTAKLPERMLQYYHKNINRVAFSNNKIKISDKFLIKFLIMVPYLLHMGLERHSTVAVR